jgi:hypothetical protein
MHRRSIGALAAAALLAFGHAPAAAQAGAHRGQVPPRAASAMQARVNKYKAVRLTTNMAALSPAERRMIPLLIDAAREMDSIYWQQAYGDRARLLASLRDPAARKFVEYNYGPWDKLAGDEPFLPGVGAKPEGATFYPRDMTKAEFEAAVAQGGPRADSLKGLYTLVRRDAAGHLTTVPYHVAYAAPLARAAAKLRQAAALAPQASLRRYLELRADALTSDNYQPSDLAWLDMKDNTIDVVIGPIESYEDALYGYKTAAEGYVLVKDREWSQRLERFAAMLPALQRGIPVPNELKAETPGTGSDLNAYDAVFYSGQANAGGKTIAINLPNDEEVQLQKGTRRLQLKNAMRAKFDAILLPIARELIVPEQLGHVTFDAFFENTMFHEVAHGLGIKNTINGHGTVREALKERAGGLEEEKADVLGLYMVTQLNRQGELGHEDLLNNYVTFLGGLFRSVRFGASDAHGRANMATFNFFAEQGAFTRDARTGRYRVDFPKMQQAVNALSEKILRLQGTGDYAGVGEFMATSGIVKPQLQHDLGRLSTAGIPVDIVFVQGMSVLNAGR